MKEDEIRVKVIENCLQLQPQMDFVLFLCIVMLNVLAE